VTRFYAADGDGTRPCSVCRQSFTPRGEWQRTCTPCWVAEKEDRLRSAAYEAGRQAGLNEARRDRATGNAAGVFADRAFVMGLIELTHPDRHPMERWDASNRVTAVLINHLKRLRADGR
jgi:hypothetical protein